ncbi:hypothetical protein V5O48_015072, partial [Marasmius crinis-equi]
MFLGRQLGPRLKSSFFISYPIGRHLSLLHTQQKPTRSVTLTPVKPSDAQNLLQLLNTYSIIENITPEPDWNAFTVDFFEHETARRLVDVFNSNPHLKTWARTQYKPKALLPSCEIISSVWQGRSRSIMFHPPVYEEWTIDRVREQFEEFGPVVHVVEMGDTGGQFEISFFRFWDAVKAESVLPQTLRRLPVRDTFTDSQRLLPPYDKELSQFADVVSESGPRFGSSRLLAISNSTPTHEWLPHLSKALRRYCVVDHQLEENAIALRFSSEDQLVHFYKSCRSASPDSLITSRNLHILDNTFNSLLFHEKLALKLGACQVVVLSLLPEHVTKDASRQMRTDFAQLGTVGHVWGRKDTSFVAFLSTRSAVHAISRMGSGTVSGTGPFADYNNEEEMKWWYSFGAHM